MTHHDASAFPCPDDLVARLVQKSCNSPRKLNACAAARWCYEFEPHACRLLCCPVHMNRILPVLKLKRRKKELEPCGKRWARTGVNILGNNNPAPWS
ncbi:leukotriene A-4 hydrolase, putative [Anopheles sinensis]|uniref:Leukotriene A-4 hydrolase, putative n=1 Tax=Anopheles sinensis TaxID=74873 RepID=A0A084VEB0_ANOSI|nr:leukotriene A-4 hydrolase, putative [Anopheles sinensis]